jgi:16S rRNA A1518/A1519 N6-dimethyltransferase RsmA/KsgA/DIM1 with predicted DNA glycosylase/AP lyase activity
MTQILCENAREVVAVEIDKKLIPILTEDTLSYYDNVTVINEDILKYLMKHLQEKYLSSTAETAKNSTDTKLPSPIISIQQNILQPRLKLNMLLY